VSRPLFWLFPGEREEAEGLGQRRWDKTVARHTPCGPGTGLDTHTAGAIGEIGFEAGTGIPCGKSDELDPYDAVFAGLRIAIRASPVRDPHLIIPNIPHQWPVRKADVLVLMRVVTPLWTGGLTQVEFMGFVSAQRFNRLNQDPEKWREFNKRFGPGPHLHWSLLTPPVTVETFKRVLIAESERRDIFERRRTA
jgi:hypothetical protein